MNLLFFLDSARIDSNTLQMELKNIIIKSCNFCMNIFLINLKEMIIDIVKEQLNALSHNYVIRF